MLNPYTILTPDLLNAMLQQPMYFVRQLYSRGCTTETKFNKKSFLLTHYTHNETDKERADRHIRLLMKDPYRRLYDSSNKEDMAKLLNAATQPTGFRIYINLLPRKWKADGKLKHAINNYMAQQHTSWNYTPGDVLKVTLKERYGELYIALLWKKQQTEVHLDEIEKFLPCAMT